jgi:hypothetical protein
MPSLLAASSMYTPATYAGTGYRLASLPDVPFGLIVSIHIHSNALGKSATRNGLTHRLDSDSIPSQANPSTLAGAGTGLWVTRSISGRVVRLWTSPPVSVTLFMKYLSVALDNPTIQGFSENMLKNDQGARFATAAPGTVDIQPVGRGATIALSGSWGKNLLSRSGGSKDIFRLRYGTRRDSHGDIYMCHKENNGSLRNIRALACAAPLNDIDSSPTRDLMPSGCARSIPAKRI